MPEKDIQSNNPTPSSTALQNAIENAQILLSYASSSGIQLAESNIKNIVKAWNSKICSEEDELNFWVQYSQLAAAVSPATAESIRAMSPQVSEGQTQIQKTVRRYTLLTFITIGILILFQAYWTCGNYIVDSINRKNEQSQQLNEELFRRKNSVGNQDNAQKGSQDNDPNSQSHEGGQKTNRRGASEVEILENKIVGLEFYIKSNYASLKNWRTVYGLIPEPEVQSAKIADSQNIEPGPIKHEDIARTQSASLVLEILRIYILPLIYGFLGTCVYILRDLSFKTKNYAFTRAATINFHIRLCLGALSGIASAWIVVSGKSSDPIMSLSPLALAFLAGYSIEILFSAMDTFIGAFTGKKFTSSSKNEKESV